MSFFLRSGSEVLVNSGTTNSQLNPSIAAQSDGSFIVTWVTFDTTDNGGVNAIDGQIFEADGTKRGAEFQVNTEEVDFQFSPSVAGLTGGGSIATWVTLDNMQDGSLNAVKAQILDAAGVKQGAEFLVNSQAISSQNDPSVTGLSNGGFVITWTTEDSAQDGSFAAIKAQVFESSGALLGAEFLVNSQSTGRQTLSTITELADGGFVISWETDDPTQDGSGTAVKAQMFNAMGVAQGAEILVNSQATMDQEVPVITGLADGGFVVVWQTQDNFQDSSGSAIKAQLFDVSGAKQGIEFLVNTEASGSQSSPMVTGLPNGGFAVAWQTGDSTQDGDNDAIKAQVFDDAGAKQGAEFLVNSEAADKQLEASIAALADGSIAITWRTDDDTQDGSGSSIKSQVFEFFDGIPDLVVSASEVSETEVNNTVLATFGTDALVEIGSYTYTLENDPSGAFSIEGNKLIVKNNGNLDYEAATSVTLTVRMTNSDGTTRDQDVILAITDTEEELRYTAQGEFLVNTDSEGDQKRPDIGDLANGGFVVTWQSNDGTQDGSSTAIKAQIFDAMGTKQGPEFLVNTGVVNSQTYPQVVGLANGDFAVTWITFDASDDGNSLAIKAQLFAADGTKQGPEILVNTEGQAAQMEPEILGLANGGFVVTWRTNDPLQDGSDDAVKAQVFDALGNKVGTEFLVNSDSFADQDSPSLTELSSGNIVMTWRTLNTFQDGSGTAIQAQIFDPLGVKLSFEFQVNTQGADDQREPDVTSLSGGGFVVTWTTLNGAQDGDGRAIKAQVFNSVGTKQGDEFLVNTEASSNQGAPNVTSLPDGGFVITWSTTDGAQDGNQNAIKAQIFDASGKKQGHEFLVNVESFDDQTDATITHLNGGDFVIAWRSEDATQDGDGQAIKAQVYSLTTEPTQNADSLEGTNGDDFLDLLAGDDVYLSVGGADTILGNAGDDMVHLSNTDDVTGQEIFAGQFDGDADTDDLHLNGGVGDYRIIQHLDTFKFYHQDHTDVHPLGRLIATATNIEQFMGQDLAMLTVEDAFSVRATMATGTAPTDMTAIRDYDGNNVGNSEDWKLIGQADVQFDGDAEFIYINQTNGRWATVGPDSSGAVVFSDFGEGGETRVVGIYIDPEVQADPSKAFGPFDSQQRFQNDLNIDNLTVIDAFDFDNDGFQELYFKVNDGTAYLRALMHADGNIQYANYQSAEQVEEYLTDLGYGQNVLDAILV